MERGEGLRRDVNLPVIHGCSALQAVRSPIAAFCSQLKQNDAASWQGTARERFPTATPVIALAISWSLSVVRCRRRS